MILRSIPAAVVSLPLFFAAVTKAEPIQLASPDGRLKLSFSLTTEGTPAYKVDRNGRQLVAESKLGLTLKDDPAFNAFAVANQQSAKRDGTWKPVCGERNEIRDHYNEVTVSLKEMTDLHRDLQIVFRAYDEGVAFRYVIPKQPGMDKVVVMGEATEFRFPADYFCHATYSAQGNYSRVPLTKIGNGAERPLFIEATDNGVAAVAEAGLLDFSRMKLGPLADKSPGLSAQLGGRVTATLPLTTPWRVILSAPDASQLLENNSLIPTLNEPCAIADTSWIKPGTVLREITLRTDGAKRTLDYCAAHHISYMLFDAGWYGKEESPASDATKTNLDPARSKGPFDLPEILRYAEEKKVGIILYVNYIAMTRQLEQILPLYHSWGVKGVKYGFVNVGDQGSTAFISKAIRLVADNHLMVDIHDEWRPTGTQRTWPNLMTAEGIRGDEEAARTNGQSLTALFSRFLAGPADNTVCYFDPRVDKLTDHAYQLAKSVCFFSPLQHIYWYDRPLPEGQTPAPGDRCIGTEPELGFFDRLPTSWDQTRVVAGEIGKFGAIARRKGKGWWVGAMNAAEPRTTDIPLDFLPKGTAYEAVIYSNDPGTTTRTHVKIERRRVDAGSHIPITLGGNSGLAMEILPVSSGK